jgi:putative thioredoxin
MLINAPQATTAISETATQTFSADVLAESQKRPVMVYFTASWCGPCQQLGPILEEAASLAGETLRIVKLDIDKHPAIPGQLGIQSVPAVIAFVKGQPVDGFMGALPKTQIINFMERLVGPLKPVDLSVILDEADDILQKGDIVSATGIYADVLGQSPGHARALAGMAQAQAMGGNLEAAQATLATIASADQSSPFVTAARARIDLLAQTAELDDSTALSARVSANPADHQSRLDLALALAATGKRAEAVNHLLTIVRTDRTWNDDAARKQLVQFFEAWGPTDLQTMSGRRQLSSLLFA